MFYQASLNQFFFMLTCYTSTLTLGPQLMISDFFVRGRCGRDRMIVGFTTAYAISAYHH
jgi:hypothetical protein